jgi:hypothetical protein
MLIRRVAPKYPLENTTYVYFFITSNDKNAVLHRYVVTKGIMIDNADFAIDGYSCCCLIQNSARLLS